MSLVTLAQLGEVWRQALKPLSEAWWDETACSVLVGLTCGVLGCFVVLRRMALIGDALSHAVLPGVVVAFLITGSSDIPQLLLGALGAGLLTAVLINVVTRFSRTKEDSSIGIVFTAMFALGIVILSAMPRGTHFDLKCFLFGDPLAVTRADLALMAIICPLVLATIALLYHRFKLVSFDPVLAASMGISVAAMHYLLMGMLSATVVAGLKTTGVILVVAMVITPASAAYQLTNRFGKMLLLSGLFGGVAALVGMSLAFVTNAPTGPAMVLVAAAIFVVCMLLSPNHGVLFEWWRKRQLARHIESEDVLKAMYRLGGAASAVAAIAGESKHGAGRVASMLKRLEGEGLVNTSGADHTLTAEGARHAERIVRSHRLWETYLGEAGLPHDHLHGEAERLEHAHELAEKLDETLGRPERDPHGSQIPRGG